MITELRPAGLPSPAGRMRRAGLAAALVIALVASSIAIRNAIVRPAPGTTVLDAGARSPRVQGIDALQVRLRNVPTDQHAWAALGSAYVQEARISGDPAYYPKAEQALRRSLDLDDTKNFEAMAGMGALSAARHDFAGALAWGNRAQSVNPYNANTYGVIGDALIELGRYQEGFAAIQRMVDLRPGIGSYARVSYARELQGDVANALKALALAAQAAATPADAAFASYFTGELYWNSGRLADASKSYHEAVAHDPNFLPGYQGLAKVDAASGRLQAAIRGYETLVAKLPLPQYVIELGDLYRLAGNETLAQQQFRLLDVQEHLFRANGVNIDLEQALFDADHRVELASGLAAAQAEWGKRQSVYVADALAWSLYANGRYEDALSYSAKALRLGTRNALFFFHKGMIERALGMRADARRDITLAREINPHFSFLWSNKVPAILRELR